MFDLPRWISKVVILSLLPRSFCGGCMLSTGVGGLSAPQGPSGSGGGNHKVPFSILLFSLLWLNI